MSYILDILGVYVVRWRKEDIEKRKKAAIANDWARFGGAYGPYQSRVLYETLNRHRNEINGKLVLVVGSIGPWVEAMLLAIGAKHITTLEYNKIQSSHPQVRKVFCALIIKPLFW